jgi:hypothetical protein
MKRLTLSPAELALVAIIAGACTADIPSAAAPSDPSLAKGGPSAAPAYTVLDVAALLPGTSGSEAHGVNDAGDVAGFYFVTSASGSTTYPFALVSGAPVTLGGGTGMAWGMSNAYVAGSSGSRPARWSLANPTQPTLLPLAAGEAYGQAKGVNDAGAAVGSVGGSAGMWLADGTRIPIATPAGYGQGEGRGIDNDGLAIFQFTVPGGNSEYAVSRAYLRLASGTTIELLPDGSDVTSYANDISEVVDGVVYIAGSTRSSTLVSRSLRWTVDASTGAILATDILATTGSHGLGVSDAGGIAGFIENSRSLRSEVYLWRGTTVLKIAPPKGSNSVRAWALSRSGQYIAGQAISGGAVRWTILTP